MVHVQEHEPFLFLLNHNLSAIDNVNATLGVDNTLSLQVVEDASATHSVIVYHLFIII